MTSATSKQAPNTSSTQTKPRHALKWLCWNINHQRDKFEGVKFEIPEVKKILLNHDIFCLQETKGVVTVNGFKCFNSNRKNSNSGGVCIGIRKALSAGASEVSTSQCDDILIVKLKAKFFNLEKDVNLVNVYNSPANGSYKKRRHMTEDNFTTTLEHLSDFIIKIPACEDIALLGDLNARTGTLEDTLTPSCFTDCSNELEEPFNVDITKIPARNNTDHTLNAYGKPFIELVQTSGLIILNGRTIGDIFGSPTCIQRNGVSVVDYVCTSPGLLNKVRYFKVGPLCQYSDHRPLSLALSINTTKSLDENTWALREGIAHAPLPYKWVRDIDPNKDTATKFRVVQNDTAFKDNIASLMEADISSAAETIALNEKVINIFSSVADQVTTQKSGKPRTNKKKWFDWDCRLAKRYLNRVEPNLENKPHCQSLRDKYFLRKKEYRAVIRSKRGAYLFRINQQINDSESVNWAALKELSTNYKDSDTFDIYDLVAFHKFFNDLYNRQCKSTEHPKEDTLEPLSEETDELKQLNRQFTIEELESAIKRLHNNKSASIDLISNEMLKCSKNELRSLLLKLFNASLEHGAYPWNCSLTTPLHKKGDRQNPDNYRAITIGSCLGKLFSSLLLNRLLEFRSEVCPDYPNQLGFRAGAQCSDHILTLSTVVEKYVKKQKSKVFACFVDYRKAFDTVCRDALMYKLKSMGISGRFFACLKNMYSNSKTRIKLIQRLSKTIDVTIGTEQGHPLSPELFKMFVHDLSTKLEELDNISLPNLNGFPVSHLLWADDLILLALDNRSLQAQLDCLDQFVSKWELSINIQKTNVMVFNSSARLLQCSYGFKLGQMDVHPVRKYCYLGIQFSLNGSFKHAIDELRKKALRAFFSIRRIVDTRALKTSTMLKLIDSLVKPVAMYACQIWLPSTAIVKEMAKPDCFNVPQCATKDAFEITHLKMLKWILGVHKNTNNNFCYGDTGRLPWAISVLPQCLRYFERVSKALEGPKCVDTLIHHAFQEQKNLNLSWYATWNEINKQQMGSNAPTEDFHINLFISQWQASLSSQSKMDFYRCIKASYKEEPYLALQSSAHRSHIAKLRSSSHDLNIERGRYGAKYSDPTSRLCRFCCNNRDQMMTGFVNLPFCEDLIVESEEHVLTECPAYHHLRGGLSDNLKSLLMLKEYGLIMSTHHVSEFGRYITQCYHLRNPKAKDSSSD